MNKLQNDINDYFNKQEKYENEKAKEKEEIADDIYYKLNHFIFQLENEIETEYENFSYAEINKIIRYLTKKSIRRKQIWQIDNNITFDDQSCILVINNKSINCKTESFQNIKNELLKVVSSLEEDDKFDNLTREEKLEKALKSIRSMNVVSIFENILINNDNNLYLLLLPFLASVLVLKKTWRTQGDDRVRLSHEVLDNEQIPINSNFNVGGELAQFPRQSNLSAKEKMNCRCYLEFS